MHVQGTQGKENPQKQQEPQALSLRIAVSSHLLSGLRNASSIVYPREPVTHFI